MDLASGPNLTDPAVGAYGLFLTSGILGGLTLLVVATRSYARAFVTRNLGIDDWLILGNMIPTIGLAVACALAGRKYWLTRGLGDEITKLRAIDNDKASLAVEVLYPLSAGVTKCSILLFYRRIPRGILPKRYLFFVKCTLGFCAAQAVSQSMANLFNCVPFSAAWLSPGTGTFNYPAEYCQFQFSFFMIVSALSIMTDLLVALLPTILFWRLAIPRSQKIVLGAIFAVGFFLCAVGIVRCATLFYVFSGFDYIRTTNRLCSWTVTQALVGCMVASAPAFKVFFVRVVPSTRSRALSDEDASVDATLEKGNDRGREQSHGGRLQRKSVVDQGGRGTFRELDTGPGAERYELGNTDGRPHSALLVPPEPSLGEIVDPRMSGVTFGRRYDDAASMQRIQQERHYPSYNFI